MASTTAASSPATTSSTTPTFDPFVQTLTLLYPDGTPFNITVQDVDNFVFYSLKISIDYAAQLGASLMLLVVLVLVTKADKRKSAIFLLNTTALALNFLRNLLACLYFTGPFSEFYAFFASDFDRVPRSAYANSVAQLVLVLVQICCVEASLSLQVHVVCVTLRRAQRRIILATSIVIALLAISCRLALSVENIQDILGLEAGLGLDRVSDAANIALTISIFWFSAAFLAKLGHAMYQRRKLGLTGFGAMQVLSVMAFQTMTIPAIFSILEYVTTLPTLESNVLTVVALFLPLSSIWAASTLETKAQGPPAQASPAKKFLAGSGNSTSSSSPFLGENQASKGKARGPSGITSTSRDLFATPSKENYPDLLKDLEAQR